MTTIYEIDPSGVWRGRTATIDEAEGAPPGWTRTAPPTLGAGEVAMWTGEGWVQARATLPDVPLDGLKAERLAQLRELRWLAETAGVIVGEQRVRTDATGQAKVAGVLQLFAADPTLAQVDWEVQPGQWVSMDRETMTAIGVAVGRHVQACFTRARELQAQIEAATDTESLEAIVLVSGWPGAGAIAPM